MENILYSSIQTSNDCYRGQCIGWNLLLHKCQKVKSIIFSFLHGLPMNSDVSLDKCTTQDRPFRNRILTKMTGEKIIQRCSILLLLLLLLSLCFFNRMVEINHLTIYVMLLLFVSDIKQCVVNSIELNSFECLRSRHSLSLRLVILFSFLFRFPGVELKLGFFEWIKESKEIWDGQMDNVHIVRYLM